MTKPKSNTAKKDNFVEDLENIPGAAPENVDTETGEVKEQPKERKLVTIVGAAEYWEFKKAGNEVFEGRFKRTFHRENDHAVDPTKKAGDLIGYVFEDANGDEHIIGNSHQIDKAFKDPRAGVGVEFRIEYKGEAVNGKGQKVNKFEVAIYEE